MYEECLAAAKDSNPRNVVGDRGYQALVAMLGTSATDEDDVEQMQSARTTIPKCPLTQQTVVDPVRNKICKHVYSRQAIVAHIEKRLAERKPPKFVTQFHLNIERYYF